jgi:hypothetical protein
MMRSLGTFLALVVAGLAAARQTPAPPLSGTAAEIHARAVELHTPRRLDEASREYARALALDPSRPASARELAIIRRFAPRLHVTETEFFPLRDFAAVLHPTERLVAYHLFWDDDIDFPEDNDPCDHEVVWVQFSSDGSSLERFWTYFHGRILSGGEAALADARAHRMRPRVNVQWGKHGSLPVGWESMPIVADAGDIERKYLSLGRPISLADYNRATWQKLRTEGRRLKDHPLSRRLAWPDTFGGDWRQFTTFTRVVDPLPLLERHRMVSVSRWNSAVIDQEFLAYNFRPKTEWPVNLPITAAPAAPAARVAEPSVPFVHAASLDAYALPPKALFDKTMPRYPNVWFHVDAALVDSYAGAVRLVADQVRGPMRLLESHGPFSNPEGADFEVTLEHLQPWEDRAHRALQHSHAFHMRYYHTALASQRLERVTLNTRDGDREFYRIAASAHYEVEHTNPNHADVEICPICGRTGEYADLRGNLVELVHDPLGVELLLNGTIRGEVVRFEHDEQEVGGIKAARERFLVHQQMFPAMTGDRNTLRIGVIVLSATR